MTNHTGKVGVCGIRPWISGGKDRSTIAKVFYIGGLVSFIGPAIMILTGMTCIGAVWELLKLCPLCM